MNIFSDFIGKYPLSKTLRFELKPQGKTQEWIDKRGIIEDDETRAQNYLEVKQMMDAYHKDFIDEVLSSEDASFDWQNLADLLEEYRQESDPGKRSQIRGKITKEQERLRKQIVACFKKSSTAKKRFGMLFNKSMIERILPEYIAGQDDYDHKLACLQSFKGFTSYFTGFYTVRQNLYSDEEKSQTIAYRLVNENFIKFMDACRQYKLACEVYPQAVKKAEQNLGEVLSEAFTPEAYNKCLSQTGISHFNDLLGGWVEEDGTKVQGLNECLNEAYQQQNHATRRINISPLYKQILSDRESRSFYIDSFKDDRQMADAILDYAGNIRESVNEETGEVINALTKVVAIMSDFKNKCNWEHIYIMKQSYSKLSRELFAGKWSAIDESINKARKDCAGPCEGMTKKAATSWAKDYISLADLSLAFTYNGKVADWAALEAKAKDYLRKIDKSQDGLARVLEGATRASILQQDEKALAVVKGYLDAVQDMYHFVKLFSCSQELDRDPDFYLELDECLRILESIVPLYNKTRNRMTKKVYNESKIKLNFMTPNLGGGWDKNKESANMTLIFRRNGKYYLGILAVGAKPSAKAFEDNPEAEDYYEKMEYKLLPNPHMTLPKVAFSASGLREFQPSDEVLEGYQEKKHIKSNDNFDLAYCHKLIDFFKGVCLTKPEWSMYDFSFSDTETYQDISQFYREVSDAGYKVSFVHVATEDIEKMIEDGSLYFFQIYNRDYAKKAHGKKNLHTLYFEGLFSSENLEDVRLKLSGGAELFYRPASIVKPYAHEVGEKMVDRWFTMPNGTKMPLPEEVHSELFRYANGKLKGALSEQAQGYLDTGLVKIKEVKHRIVKNRRFTEDKFFLHVPIAFNYKSTGMNFLNSEVCEFLQNNPDVNVIGVDRGERCLLYATVINQHGEILKQINLNIIDGYDYHAKLQQRSEKRQDQRRSWRSIDEIKNLKNGYISKAVKQITDLMMEYNAIVVLEDLNSNFKRSRSCIDKQTYQKFEKMLIEKLNYLVTTKDPAKTDTPGGALQGYQLTNAFDSFETLGKQSGFLFYASPWHTASIDPATGFVNLFPYSMLGYSNEDNAKAFFSKFDRISFDAKKAYFEFEFSYSNFDLGKNKDFRDHWCVCSNEGDRVIHTYKNQRPQIEIVNVNKNLKELFQNADVDYRDGHDLKEEIGSMSAAQMKALLSAFRSLVTLRNTTKEEDYILSPVQNGEGVFFKTGAKQDTLLTSADAVSAYCIALKGLQMAKQDITITDKGTYKLQYPKTPNLRWLEWMQEQEYQN